MPMRTRKQHRLDHLRDVRDTPPSRCPDAIVLLDEGSTDPLVQPCREKPAGHAATATSAIHWRNGWPTAELGAWLRSENTRSGRRHAAPADGSLPAARHQICRSARTSRLLLARDISHLSRLEQMRRDFVANVSHELRTPLTVIHGYLELLDPETCPKLAPVLGEMRRSPSRMAQIVEDLLTLSRLETRRTRARRNACRCRIRCWRHCDAKPRR